MEDIDIKITALKESRKVMEARFDEWISKEDKQHIPPRDYYLLKEIIYLEGYIAGLAATPPPPID
jgi:hypothetical protein